MNQRRNTARSVTTRRGAALYVAVMATALMVTLLGLAGLAKVQIQRREATELADRIAAREAANGAAGLALINIAADNNWRTNYASGVESTPLAIGGARGATVSWVMVDSDGDLTNQDTDLQLSGVGRVGDSVQVATVGVKAVGVGPSELRNYDILSGASSDKLADDKWWCQYLRPDLPDDAISWRVTRVEFYCRRDQSNRDLQVVLYEPTASNWPSGVVLDSVNASSNDFGSSWGWRGVTFSGGASLGADDGVCVALTTSENQEPLEIAYRSGGVGESQSALITGDPTWTTYDTDKALLYRVYGEYVTADAACEVIEGTWEWGALP
ncbi:hypothetical protein KOR34_41370 [Posidoniimonas corsicana]|uniref:Type 4 fimbrial biogenesis protein PilX N-terminal domain-containing protein n=1 Tax=Posidoniimonas corsicana TaxID=1938618 RepID=A0A5C5V188_9BACT|nr:hypothetical protein [Posidoniimonas corsicana]TWT32374.1 hypothetical protein KOR34_41370 [Posidoniimonas corsicana]